MSDFSAEDKDAALFANLVMQQANMATMLMGAAPNPETGKPIKDLEAAQLFIDQLEMLQTKTKGNLTSQEEGFIKQTLMALRLEFVNAVKVEGNEPATAPAAAPASTPPEAAKPQPTPEPVQPPPAADAPSGETAKKFSKKY